MYKVLINFDELKNEKKLLILAALFIYYHFVEYTAML